MNGATEQVKEALNALGERVAEAGSRDPGITGILGDLFADVGELAHALTGAQRTCELAPQAVSSRAQVSAFTHKSTGDIEDGLY